MVHGDSIGIRVIINSCKFNSWTGRWDFIVAQIGYKILYTTASYCLDLLIRLSSLFVVLMPAAGPVDARQFR